MIKINPRIPVSHTFSEFFTLRLSKAQRKDIQRILKKNKDKYSSISHFCRVAVVRLIREEK